MRRTCCTCSRFPGRTMAGTVTLVPKVAVSAARRPAGSRMTFSGPRCGNAGSVTPIAAAAHGIYGKPPFMGDAKDLLHLLAVARPDDGGHSDVGTEGRGARHR